MKDAIAKIVPKDIQYDVDLAFAEWDGDGTAIVDLDTGVDAGHPDFDYLEPWTGDKVIYSAKWDGVWTLLGGTPTLRFQEEPVNFTLISHQDSV